MSEQKVVQSPWTYQKLVQLVVVPVGHLKAVVWIHHAREECVVQGQQIDSILADFEEA